MFHRRGTLMYGCMYVCVMCKHIRPTTWQQPAQKPCSTSHLGYLEMLFERSTNNSWLAGVFVVRGTHTAGRVHSDPI